MTHGQFVKIPYLYITLILLCLSHCIVNGSLPLDILFAHNCSRILVSSSMFSFITLYISNASWRYLLFRPNVFWYFFFVALVSTPPPPKKRKLIITFKHKCANYCWPFIFIIVHFHSLLLCFLSLRTYCYHFSLFRDVWRRYLF